MSDLPNEPKALAPPRNIRITVEYDGTHYQGWEAQKTGVGIQDLIQQAIKRITGEDTTVNGAGRTDAGVHASGQVANFTLQKKTPIKDLQRAMNAVLPDDISIMEMEETSLYFHARFSATGKLYRYRVYNHPIRSPLADRVSHHIRSPLDLEKMRAAAALFVGTHDFAGFAKEVEIEDDTVRTITRIDVTPVDRMVHCDLYGDGFLYNMVRIICGTLVQVGLSRIDPALVAHILSTRDRKSAGPTLPARGLELVRVFFDRC